MKKGIFKYNGCFKLENGEKLDSLEISYHISGEPTLGRKVIWICHALTANSNAQEWWSGLIGAGKLFDTQKYCIVCANMVGSCYGSTGPTSIAPNGKPYLMKFPLVTVRDTVRAHNLLREYLKIDEIELITGASIGGFQALEWSIIYPSVIKNLLLIACNAAVTPWGAAFNESQRMALLSDPSFEEQKDALGGKKGLETARSIALLSYRSYKGYNHSQQEQQQDFMLASRACSYQEYQGKKLASRFNAYSYYTLTKCIDSHNVGRARGGLKRALAKITAPTVVVGIESDLLFPIEEQIFMAQHIKNAEFELIKSIYGHDGFLLEYEQTQNIVNKHFKL